MATEFLHEIDIQLQGDIVFSTVVDEEIGGMGTLALVDRGHQADAGIMTEATALAVSPLCHGILWGRIKINGIGGHAELKPASWDEGGPVDAVWLTRQILDGIDILNRRWANEGCKNHPLMDLPNQVIVTQVNVGEHPSSMAGVGEIVIDVQYLPQERDKAGLGGHVQREVEEHISRVCRVDPFLRKNPAKVEWILDADCTELATDHPIVETTRDAISAIGHKPQLWGLGAHADIGTLTELGQTPTINFGPGNPIQAHQPNECVSVSDLVAATQILALTIERWCA
jgi:acetylornithine deacetylase